MAQPSWWSVYSSSTSFFLDQVYADFLDFDAAPLQALAADYTIGTKTLARGYTSVNFYGKLVYNPIGAGCFARFEFPHLLQTSNVYDPRDVAVLRRLVEERTDSLYEKGIYGGENEIFRDFTPPGDDIPEPDLVPELLNDVEILSPTKCFKNRGVQYEKKKVTLFRNSKSCSSQKRKEMHTVIL